MHSGAPHGATPGIGLQLPTVVNSSARGPSFLEQGPSGFPPLHVLTMQFWAHFPSKLPVLRSFNIRLGFREPPKLTNTKPFPSKVSPPSCFHILSATSICPCFSHLSNTTPFNLHSYPEDTKLVSVPKMHSAVSSTIFLKPTHISSSSVSSTPPGKAEYLPLDFKPAESGLSTVF